MFSVPRTVRNKSKACGSTSRQPSGSHAITSDTTRAAPWTAGAAALGLALGGSGVAALEEVTPISITSNFDSGNIELVSIQGTQVSDENENVQEL